VPDVPAELVLGRASRKRSGSDVTIVTWGAMVPRVLSAAEALEADGISCDVLDLITLTPWDVDAVLESVGRTGRAIIVHQASRRSGFGAEVAAVVSERGFDLLDAPVARVGGLNVPVPFSPPLENFVLPDADRVVAAVRRLG
jgi:pyruvate dehydrogenase E1 component beta subunit